jgi:2-desacetyl-2-hydroxyethyl bacteriochlorophyllide A dehydrogenase
MKAARSYEGALQVIDIPIPEITDSTVLVKTDYSVISTATELMVLRKRINAFLGYSGTGIVQAVGANVDHVVVGQRVACYGAHTHADYFLAGKQHVVAVPDHVDPQEAAFAGLATIAMQGLRQADLRFGETVVVIGLGLIGQLIARIAHAASYQVFAVDYMEERCRLLEEAGVPNVFRSAEQAEQQILAQTRGHGADCVMICANAKSHRLIDQALNLICDRGKVVIVGDTNTEFDRDKLFAKEAQITISRAGGPGRYDPDYEQGGKDYPYGYVRWTLNRNLEGYVRLLAEGRLSVRSLITNKYPLEQKPLVEAYRISTEQPALVMGSLIEW